jgi:hypothetical protein
VSEPIIDEDFGGPGSSEQKVLDHFEAFFAGDYGLAYRLLGELCADEDGRQSLTSFTAAIFEQAATDNNTTPAKLLAIMRRRIVDGETTP